MAGGDFTSGREPAPPMAIRPLSTTRVRTDPILALMLYFLQHVHICCILIEYMWWILSSSRRPPLQKTAVHLFVHSKNAIPDYSLFLSIYKYLNFTLDFLSPYGNSRLSSNLNSRSSAVMFQWIAVVLVLVDWEGLFYPNFYHNHRRVMLIIVTFFNFSVLLSLVIWIVCYLFFIFLIWFNDALCRQQTWPSGFSTDFDNV